MAEIRTCDVCRAIDNDITPKECVFCNICQAYICLKDLPRWDRRTKAMLKMWGNKQGPKRSAPPAPVQSSGCGDCGKNR